jgi:hypothetical protein
MPTSRQTLDAASGAGEFGIARKTAHKFAGIAIKLQTIRGSQARRSACVARRHHSLFDMTAAVEQNLNRLSRTRA